ncbi:MAG: class I SAM-dependent methyltransferase [Thermoanaerobaculia bacterium]
MKVQQKLPAPLRRIARRLVPLSLRLALARKRDAAEVWDEAPASVVPGYERQWTQLAQVRELINRRISGDPAVDAYMYFLRTRLSGRLPVDSALTIGCGEGALERGLAGHSFATRHDAVDVAPRAVERAAAAARQAGLEHLRYHVANADSMELEPDSYDVVLGVQAVHHIEKLEHLFRQVAIALRPGGFLFLDEFLGPSRFQWSTRQLEVVDGILSSIPERLRRSLADGRVRRRALRPTVGEVRATDPSEAVRSGEILAALSESFEVLEVRPYGGTVLHLLLHDLAGNFVREGSVGREILSAIADLEWALVSSGDLPSDFAVVVARPRR